MTITTAPSSTAPPAPAALSLVDQLDELHDAYVAAINNAVAHDDEAAVAELSVSYDVEAVEMVARREGRMHLLSLFENGRPVRRRPGRHAA